MARKDKGPGIQKKLPTKSEVSDVNRKLLKLAKESNNFENPISTADKVYSNDNEIVVSSVFKQTKPVSPSGKTITIEGELPL